MTGVRVLAVWAPDWPVVAAARAAGVPEHRPAAVLVAGRVLACSAVARAQGVRRGLRRREAQARCPDLAVLDRDPDGDARAFEPVVLAVEALAPGVEIVRPGLLALPAKGPVGWFGGEREAAERLVDEVAARTGVEAQVGIADGLFAAVLAARRGLAVAAGATPAFLAPLGVEELDRDPDVDRADLVDLLRRLGLRSLGAFAALDAGDVASRFGADAVLGHRLARGLDPRPPVRRAPPGELGVEIELDPPVERIDAAAFAARGLAERLHVTLAGHGLSCTRLGITAWSVSGTGIDAAWSVSGTGIDAAWSVSGTGIDAAWSVSGTGIDAALTVGGTGACAADGTGAGAADGTGAGAADGTGAGAADGTELHRIWRCADPLTPAGTVDRVRWQLDSWLTRGGTGALTRLRLVPEETVAAGALQLGLWGEVGEADERAGRALVRVQALLGPDAVVTAVLTGGRDPAERVRRVPWGDERPPSGHDHGTGAGPAGSGRKRAEPVITAELPDGERPAPAGWPDDVLRATGRRSAADVPFTPPSPVRAGARRRLPDRASPGTRSRPPRDPAPQWPGRLPAPSPASVPPDPLPARLLDAGGEPVGLAAPDRLSGDPHRCAVDGGPDREVLGWAGPWPVAAQWWAGAVSMAQPCEQAAVSMAQPCEQAAVSMAQPCKQAARLQVVLDAGTALLLLHRAGRWWVTGSYD